MDSSASSSPGSTPPPTTPEHAPAHPMVTRLRDLTWKPLKHMDGTVTYTAVCTTDTDDADIEPTLVAITLQQPRWKAAMDAEFAALQKNQTWRFVPHRRGLNVTDSR